MGLMTDGPLGSSGKKIYEKKIDCNGLTEPQGVSGSNLKPTQAIKYILSHIRTYMTTLVFGGTDTYHTI